MDYNVIGKLLTEALKLANSFRGRPAGTSARSSAAPSRSSAAGMQAKMTRLNRWILEDRLVEVEARATTALGLQLVTFGLLLQMALELDDETPEDAPIREQFEGHANEAIASSGELISGAVRKLELDRERLRAEFQDLVDES